MRTWRRLYAVGSSGSVAETELGCIGLHLPAGEGPGIVRVAPSPGKAQAAVDAITGTLRAAKD